MWDASQTSHLVEVKTKPKGSTLLCTQSTADKVMAFPNINEPRYEYSENRSLASYQYFLSKVPKTFHLRTIQEQ